MLERATIRHRSPTRRRPGRAWLVAVLAPTLAATLLALLTSGVSAQPPSPNPDDIGRAPATVVPGDPVIPTAPTWEYRTLFLTWDSDALNWVADFSDGTRIEGLDAVLNGEGANGWELVAVMPEQWTELVDDAIIQEVRRLRIFLKKPVS
jgi:hypothetical protein